MYDLLRTSRMNAIYHGCRLGNLQRINFWMEVVTAATASGSGLAAFLDAGPMKPVWQTLSLTAATIAVAKPIYAPGKRIEVFTRQQQGYHANYFALRKLAFLVQQEGGISVEHKRRYDTAYDRHVQLSTEDEASPRMAYVARARAQTNQELPSTSLWWPASAPEQTAVADPANPPPPPPSNGRRALVAAPLELASPPWFNRFAAGTSAVGAALLIWLAVGPGSAIDGWIGKSGRTSAVDRPTQAEPSGAPDQPTGG